MKRKLLILTLLLSLAQISFAIDFFNGSYAEALVKAKAENKNVLLYFTATWCGPCQYMQKYIFPSPALTTYVNTKFIALKLDIDTKDGKFIYEKAHQPKGPRGVPAYVIVNANEEILKTAVGGMKEKAFQEFLATDANEVTKYKVLADSLARQKIEQQQKPQNKMSKFIFDSSYSKWQPGLKLGTNLMGFKGTHHNHDVTVGYEFGIFFNRSFKAEEEKISFWDQSRYDLQLGLTLNSKGGTLLLDGDKNQVNIHYLQFEWANNFAVKGFHRIQLSVIPYAGLALWGNRKAEAGKQKLSFDDDLERNDYGLKLGASKNYGSFKAYFGYDLGLNDIQKGIDKAYNRGFYFSAALILGK